jgi:hypothetical protein
MRAALTFPFAAIVLSTSLAFAQARNGHKLILRAIKQDRFALRPLSD